MHVISSFELKVLTLNFDICFPLGLHLFNEIILREVFEDLSTFFTVAP